VKTPLIAGTVLTAAAFIACACTNVNGRIRPAWDPSWSELSCTDASAGDEAVLVVLVKDGARNILAGVTVTATPQAHDVGGPRQSVTDPYGETRIKLAPGIWQV
jgi:hypothetical protein